jgi:hypothetical protein
LYFCSTGEAGAISTAKPSMLLICWVKMLSPLKVLDAATIPLGGVIN